MKENKIPLIAFQGEHYAFSEMAAKKFFNDQCECFPCRTFEDVFSATLSERSDLGIIPVENSLTGSIHRNFDLLLQNNLQIVGEIPLRIEQHLIANQGTELDHIDTIYSHPQALEQCREFLSTLPKVETVASYDTAGSVKTIHEKRLHNAAAIAGKWAAQDYDMVILREEIEDIPENFTRFFFISKKPANLGQPNKTSIVFSMKSIPGALFKCLSVFALRDIDLVKIESRPLRGKPWSYLFYLDFSGSMEQEVCKKAIGHLEEITDFIKILGSYPSGNG
jgi:prephenate dehydratase